MLRLDSGVTDGSAVGIFYDPMLAKVICWAPDRDQAAAALSGALARARIHGLITNRDLLVRVLRHPAFLAGQTDTAFLDRHGLAAQPGRAADQRRRRAAVGARGRAGRRGRPPGRARVLGGLPTGWRNVPSQLQRKAYERLGGQPRRCQAEPTARYDVGYRIDRGGLIVDGRDDVRLVSMAPDLVELDGRRDPAPIRGRRVPAAWSASIPALGPVALRPVSRFTDPAARRSPGRCCAPMPGTVARLGVASATRSPPASRCSGSRP